MKISKLLLASLFFGTALTSCNLETDEKDNYTNGTFKCCNQVIPANGNTFATYAEYTLSFYLNTGNVSISTNSLNLGATTASFNTNIMDSETRYYTVDGRTLDVTSFSGGSANGNGANVQNLQGFTTSIFNIVSTNDPQNPAYPFTAYFPLVMSYTLNHDYTVKTFMPDAVYTGTTHIRSVGGTMAPFANDDIRYRIVFSQAPESSLKKADIIFYNARFAAAMPVTINFVLQGLDVTYTKNGYIISNADGKPVVPQLYEASGLTPVEGYQFNSFEFINSSDDLTMANAMYTVQIDNKYTGTAIYSGDFSGYYARSSYSK